MITNLKAYLYHRGTDQALDDAYSTSTSFGLLKLGNGVLFWKTAFRWYCVALSDAVRVYRRVEPVYGKLCCGGSSYDIESLVLVLKDGTELELLIGRNGIGNAIRKDAERLMMVLQEAHPELQFGKP